MMKRVVLFLGIGIIAMSSCNNKSDQAKEAAVEDSITIANLDSQKDSLMTLVGDISSNLAEINRLENIVSSQEFSSESPSKKQEILNNIVAIKNELALRRQKLDELEARLKKSNGYTANLKKTIEGQKDLLAEQDKKIAALEDELAKANIKIEGLNTRVDSLHTEVTTISKEKQVAERKSEELGNQLNTCYYIVATNKELKSKKILEKKFLGKTKIMEGDFDRNAFVKADRRKLSEIPTGSKSVKILTKQPSNSYKIVDVDGKKVIRIINSSLFWEKSDFIVIEVK